MLGGGDVVMEIDVVQSCVCVHEGVKGVACGFKVHVVGSEGMKGGALLFNIVVVLWCVCELCV